MRCGQWQNATKMRCGKWLTYELGVDGVLEGPDEDVGYWILVLFWWGRKERHALNVAGHRLNVTRQTKHVTRHTSHVTRHTSRVEPGTLPSACTRSSKVAVEEGGGGGGGDDEREKGCGDGINKNKNKNKTKQIYFLTSVRARDCNDAVAGGMPIDG